MSKDQFCCSGDGNNIYMPDNCGTEAGWNPRRPILTAPPPRFTTEEWKLGTKLIHKSAEHETQVAEHLEAEAARVAEEQCEVAKNAASDVDWYFKERLQDIEHWKDELARKFGEINVEVDAQLIYRARVQKSLDKLCHIIAIDTEIIGIRENRVGIDLVYDAPSREIVNELKMVEGEQGVLKRTINLCTEQLRLLRKTGYNINKELKDKDIALEIDKLAYQLDEHRPEVAQHCDMCFDNDYSDTTEIDWEEFTKKNKLTAEKEMNASVQLRAHIDSLLRQAYEDIQRQVCSTNDAFDKRLREVIIVKEDLEFKHADITVKVREVESTVCKLEKAFEEKKSAAALAETRLAIRARRPNCELVKDAVQRRLILELHELKEGMNQINMKILQGRNVIKNLQRNQLELEDAINIKCNTISIEETKAMPLRNSISVIEY